MADIQNLMLVIDQAERTATFVQDVQPTTSLERKEGVWYSEGTCVFTLRDSGTYHKGRPALINKQWFNIYGSNGLDSMGDECVALAADIAGMLNERDQKKFFSDLAKTPGREFVIYNSNYDRFLNDSTREWESDKERGTIFKCPDDVLGVLRMLTETFDSSVLELRWNLLPGDPDC